MKLNMLKYTEIREYLKNKDSLLIPIGTLDKFFKSPTTSSINTISGTTGIFGALVLYLVFNSSIILANSSTCSSSLKI